MAREDEAISTIDAPAERAVFGASSSLSDGTRVEIERAPDGERVRLVSPSGLALLEYDTRTGSVRLSSPRGDLVLAAPNGSVRVEASRGFEVRTQGPCVLEASQRGEASEAGRARLVLEGERATVTAGVVETTAREVSVSAERVRTVARGVTTTAESVRVLAGVFETRATRVLERAVHVYQEVDEQLQVRAGRVRLLAREALHAFGKRAFLGAEEEVKIDGEQIRLG